MQYFEDNTAFLTQSGQLYNEANAMALGKVGTPASRIALERALEDPNPMVRNAVQKAMRAETATA